MADNNDIDVDAAAMAEASALPTPPLGHVRKTFAGTILVFAAEALILPTGLITASYLTAWLGTVGYGAFTLAATVVSWLEWTITSVFARPTIKFIGETEDWPPVAAAVVKQYFWVSSVTAVILALLAHPLATLLRAEELTHPLRLFSIDIPIFGLAQAYRNILVGRGHFTRRAVGSAVRWVVRLFLILWFVGSGWWLEGAIWASIATSVVELAVNFAFVRPPWRTTTTFPMNRLWGYAGPLLISVLGLRLFEKLDLMVLQRLGGSIADAGVYGAAQNLAVVPGIFAMSFTPLVLATLSRQLGEGDEKGAHGMARMSIHAVVLMLPAAMLAAGASNDIIGFIYRPEYAAASQILARLIVGSWSLMMISTASAILVAAGRPGWTLIATAPLLPLAIAGHYLMIPRFGPNGAALVTMAVGLFDACACVAAVWMLWKIVPSAFTLLRAAIISAAAYYMGTLVPSHGVMLIVKMLVILMVCGGFFALLGEFSMEELDFVKSFISRKRAQAA